MISSRRMRWGNMQPAWGIDYKILVGKPKEKTPLGKHSLDGRIKIKRILRK
jgi:hypothetical protein